MHPIEDNGSGKADCTHFCYFPQMWQSVWFELYRVLTHANISDATYNLYHYSNYLEHEMKIRQEVNDESRRLNQVTGRRRHIRRNSKT